jgi:hypothetical protein
VAAAPYTLVQGTLVPKADGWAPVVSARAVEEPSATGCPTGLHAEGAAFPAGIELSCRDSQGTLVRQERWWPNGVRMSLREGKTFQVWDLAGRLSEGIDNYHDVQVEKWGSAVASEQIIENEGEIMTVTDFAPSGLLEQLVDYKRMEPSGRWRTWYPNGQLRQDGDLSCPLAHCMEPAGQFVEYYADGRKAAEGQYKVTWEGFYRIGDWTHYDVFGKASVEHNKTGNIMWVLPPTK